MNIIVCENSTALLRDESKIEDAFLATLRNFQQNVPQMLFE